jgi:hypothetical protein
MRLSLAPGLTTSRRRLSLPRPAAAFSCSRLSSPSAACGPGNCRCPASFTMSAPPSIRLLVRVRTSRKPTICSHPNAARTITKCKHEGHEGNGGTKKAVITQSIGVHRCVERAVSWFRDLRGFVIFVAKDATTVEDADLGGRPGWSSGESRGPVWIFCSSFAAVRSTTSC